MPFPGVFRPSYTIIRGHGGSSKKQSSYEIQTLVDDLLGLLNFWGLDRVHLMGHSMGGRVALLFALTTPRETREPDARRLHPPQRLKEK